MSRLLEKPDQHLSVWSFSNPGDKVKILVESKGQICIVVLRFFWTLSPGFENTHGFKCWSGIFQTILTYMNILENYQNNISADIELVKNFTQVRFSKTKSYPKVRKSQWKQDGNKTAQMMVKFNKFNFFVGILMFNKFFLCI